MCGRSFLAMTALCLSLVSCSKDVNVRGTYIPGEDLKKLEVSKDNFASVIEKIGSPFTLLSKTEWVYISKKEHPEFFSNARPVSEKRFKLVFNSQGILVKIEPLQVESIRLDFDRNTTDVNKK